MPQGRTTILENTLSKLGEGACISSFRWGILFLRSGHRRRRSCLNSGHSTMFRDLQFETRKHEHSKYKKDKRCCTWSLVTIKLSRHLWNLCMSNLPCCGTCEASASVVTWDGACDRRGFQPFWGAKSVYNSRWCFLMWLRRPVVDVLFEYW